MERMRPRHWLVLGGCLAFLGLPTAPRAQDDGFTPLFNGKNLDGWVYGTRNGKPNQTGQGYQVENGVLFTTKEDGGNLFTEKDTPISACASNSN